MNLASLLGNIMVRLAVYRNQRIRLTTHRYIVALAISDLLSCTVGSMPFTATTLITGEWKFGQMVCEIQAFITYFALNISPTSMGLAALNRYIWIGLRLALFGELSLKCLNCEVYWLVIKFTFYFGYASCIVSHISKERKAIHYGLVISIYFAIPLLVAMFSYYHVYQTIRHHNLDIVPALQNRTRQARITLHEINISKSLSLVTTDFMLCWLPECGQL